MCISENIIEEEEFRLVYQRQWELYLAQSGEYLSETREPVMQQQVASMPELLVVEAHMPLAA